MTIIPDNSLLLANQVDRPKNAENYGNMKSKININMEHWNK